MNLPNMKQPCKDCPFRKDSQQGWLGSERMTEILSQKSFTCHKTNKELQCAGHLIIKKDENDFYKLAERMSLDLGLKGHELIFETEKECIEHHGNSK